MNKVELASAIAEKTALRESDSKKAITAFIEVVTEALISGEKVQLAGFGTFEVSERSARKGRNPQTGETINIPASKFPKFKAGKALKKRINTDQHGHL